MGVRSFGKASILSLKSDVSPSLHNRSPFATKEVMAIRPSELAGGYGGAIVDMSFVSPFLPDFYLVTLRGNVFLSSLDAERKSV